MRRDAARLYAAGRYGASMSVDERGLEFAKDGVFSCELDAADYDDAPHLVAYTREVMLTAPGIITGVSRVAYGTKLAVALRGAAYPKHVDNACEVGANGAPADRRWITLIYYLNPEWKPGDGGELRLWRADGTTLDVEPRGNTLVAFKSDVLLHAVLPSRSDERYALTIWLVNDGEAASHAALCAS
ncbi:2OG-Fe(II) oxygenase superfamily-domain-containing protein [Pelagophyceae sp. CCMP2097]|nr:2OG-Fe(II) oxygenase superfamily-domain-containing protein [Pelagophyceae sp. CCMP2097]